MFEHEYKEAIMKLATFQPTWEEKTAAIYQILQVQEEERIEFIKSLLEKFITVSTLILFACNYFVVPRSRGTLPG